MYDDAIPISALQHYLYCPRQCALIHVERQWVESRYTAEGRLLHERTDKPGRTSRKNVRIVTALPIASANLGIAGIADVVEFHATLNGERAYPVEYKRGRPKAHRADEVQLCAQVLCLEAMFGYTIHEGALFYGKSRRRQTVQMDDELRRITLDTVESVRTQLLEGITPRALYEPKKCEACSLLSVCQPLISARNVSVADWLSDQLGG